MKAVQLNLDFPNDFKEWKKENGYTVEGIALMLNCSSSHVQASLSGRTQLKASAAERYHHIKRMQKLEKEKSSDALVIVAPPYTHLSRVKELIQGVKLSAQNCASEESGAYTGEVSPDMLKSVGVEYVILGHSERRAYYGEDDLLLNKKTKLALSKGLKPIFCCGEVLEEREGGKLYDVIRKQISVGLKDLSKEDMAQVVIAYEPVWAIGTGVVATPDQAQEMHKFIRDLLAELFDEEVASDTTILYGGSCKPSNAAELFANPDVDGGLIGGASLKAEDFLGIVNAY